MTQFKQEYMNSFYDDAKNARLKELALQYLKDTEDYDWTLCRFRRGNMAMFHSFEQVSASNIHATERRKYYEEVIRNEGLMEYPHQSFVRVVRSIQPYFDSVYQPPITNWREIPEIKP